MYWLRHTAIRACASNSKAYLLIVMACSVMKAASAWRCVCTALAVIWQHAADALMRYLQQPVLQFCCKGDV